MTNNKIAALQYIKTLAEQGAITKDELNRAYDSGCKHPAENVSSKKLSIAEVLYYVGGAIIFLGISILIWQNWSTFAFPTKVLVTLGSAIAAYFVAVLFNRDERTEAASTVFFLLSALLSPLGIWIVLNNAGYDAASYLFQSIVAGILFSTYLVSYIILRKDIFIALSVMFGTWLFLSITSFMAGSAPQLLNWKFHQYRTLTIGATYMLLGYSFAKTKQNSIPDLLYNFGAIGVLGAALALGGWKPNQNIFWELAYPTLIFGSFFLGVRIKNNSFLTWGMIFLMIYILKITSEYFANSLGWPLALVIAGVGVVGAGYVSLTVKKKYL